jgi:hypothetical protein
MDERGEGGDRKVGGEDVRMATKEYVEREGRR